MGEWVQADLDEWEAEQHTRRRAMSKSMSKIQGGNGNNAVDLDAVPPPNESRHMIVDHVPAIPDEDRQAVERGLSTFHRISNERDDWRKKYEDQLLENERLKIEIERAREGERLHVQRIVDEAVLEGKKAETEISILREELSHQRRDLSMAHAALADRTAQLAKVMARLDVIRAAMKQTMEENDDDGE